MSLSNKKLIGYWKILPNMPFQARTFDNGQTWYLCQVLEEFPDSFIVRGKQLALNTNEFTLSSGVTTDEVNQLAAATDTYGVTQPTAFVMPAGYVKKFATDGSPFYENVAERLAFDKGDTDGDGVPEPGRSANLLTQVTDWVKANQVLAIGIGIAIFIVFKQMSGGKKKKGFLAGLL